MGLYQNDFKCYNQEKQFGGKRKMNFLMKSIGRGILPESDFFSKAWEYIKDFAVHSGLRIIAAILIVIIGIPLARKLIKAYEKSKAFNRVNKDIQGISKWVVKYLLYLAVIALVIVVLGIPTASIATLISSVTLAIGLALQGSLTNIAGGIMLLAYKPFHVGDYIEASGNSGTVEDIGAFYTTLKTVDNRRIVVPNGTLSNANIVNFSSYETRRVDITVSASASCDSEKVKEIIRNVIDCEGLAMKEPEPFVRLNDCTDGKLNYTVRVWCKTEDYFTLYNDLQEDLRTAFVEHDIAPALNTMRITK